MQNEIALGYTKQVRGRSMCNTDPKKTSYIQHVGTDGEDKSLEESYRYDRHRRFQAMW